jgi:hypothetical protein
MTDEKAITYDEIYDLYMKVAGEMLIALGKV